jgi:hypothetical protein
MKIIKGNLIMKEDMTFEEDLKVKGNIFGKDGIRFNLIIKGDLNCLDLNCENLNCLDLNCGNLNCLDLNCGNCSYYAVAFAYYNIKCKSIKGRRENSKHFVLDGKIEIIEDKPKICDKCGSVLK